MQILKHCNADQKSQINQKISELTELSNELDIAENEIQKYDFEDDSQIIKISKEINKIYQKVNFFLNYDLDLNLYSMKIGIKEEVKEKIFEIIQDSYYTDIEFVQIKGGKKKFFKIRTSENERYSNERKMLALYLR